MKKAVKITIIALIAVVIVAAIIYSIPQKISRELTVCSLGGVTKEISMELVFQRNLFRPNDLKGNITVDGQMYCSIYGYKNSDGEWKRIVSRSPADLIKFFSELHEKYILGVDNSNNVTFWVEKDAENISKLENNGRIELFSKDKNFDQVAVWIFIPEEYPDYIGYYGPAETAEEAEAMMNEIYDVAEEA